MEIIRGIDALHQNLPKPVVTIGNFDGVHVGHQKIIGAAVAEAKAIQGTSVAITFRPHPQEALHPERRLPLLTTYDEKLELMAELGLDVVIEQPFSREFSFTEGDQFFTELLVHKLSTQSLIVGYDFSFGKERKSHIANLEALCQAAGVKLQVVPPHRMGSEVMSSSKIRQHLLNHELDETKALMGREFFYRGNVIRGQGRGRQLGFPTANLQLENKLRLPYGVYATLAILKKENRPFLSITNIGVRPTFPDPELPALVETHLLDTTLDLYGSLLEVRFIQHLRSERPFSGVDALIHQIGLDIEMTRQVFRSRNMN